MEDILLIFEMANNHQGDLELGKQIIDMVSEIVSEKGVKLAAIKFQYRDIDSFVHKDYVDSDLKYVKRFLQTKLSKEEFVSLAEYAREKELLVISTPFDEESVRMCVETDVDYIKIASCSLNDWSLLEAVSETDKKLIVSTGGHTIEQIDDAVNFLTHKNMNFSLMHCVSLYPTELDMLNMDFIDKLKERYPNIQIGYSGHESLGYSEFSSMVAVSKGAVILERHVGIKDLNDYSMDAIDAKMWVDSVLKTKKVCGAEDKEISQEEKDNIRNLQRGVYANRGIKKDVIINGWDVYYAIPCLENQTTSGDFNKYRAIVTASKDYPKDEAICENIEQENGVGRIREYVHKVKGIISEAGIDIGNSYELELSHHYGFDNFMKYGAVIISLINREYCKKLIIQFPEQTHPEHFHKNKEETFHVLWGSMKITVEGRTYDLKKGAVFLVERHRTHSFMTDNGVVFEEISTTHVKGDSFYTDINIYKSDPIERKTIVEKL